MKNLTKKEQFKLLFAVWYTLDSLYADYAKSVGLSYTTMLILNMIYEGSGTCTQKILTEKTFLPKQTINTVVTGFYRDGLVVLKEMPDDRRNKTIHLTKKGKELADKIYPKLDNAAMKALEEFDEYEINKLLELMQTYVEKVQINLKSS